MQPIFVSYPRHDLQFVERLVNDLKARNVNPAQGGARHDPACAFQP
jgi:hypothetical protein